jgi:hypothetical protein
VGVKVHRAPDIQSTGRGHAGRLAGIQGVVSAHVLRIMCT